MQQLFILPNPFPALRFPRLQRACALMTVLALFAVSCTGTGTSIGSSVTLCCPGHYESYEEFGVETADMPIFLRDYVVQEFDTAFREKGLRRNDRINDLRVQLRYNHVNLYPEQQRIDPFIRADNINVVLGYVATIEVEMRETSSGDLVWAGSISRIHNVAPGEYMHEGRAREAFQQAFRNLLETYPTLADSGE